jgi:hypothetical protein
VIQLSAIDDVGQSASTNLQVTVESPVNVLAICTNADTNLVASIATTLGEQPTALSSVDLQNLTTLLVANSGLGGPCVWSWLTNLASLSLDGSSITNLDSLAGLSQLSSIVLEYTEVTNFSVLAGLPNLQSLRVNGNPGAVFAVPWTGFANLTSLSLEDDSITNLTFLTNLTTLTSLDLDNNLIADISPLAGLTNLATLMLKQNRISNIQTLTNLPFLATVDVRLNLLDLTNGVDDGLFDSTPTAMAVSSLQQRSPSVTIMYLPQAWPIAITLRPEWVIAPSETNQIFFSVADADPDDTTFSLGVSSSNADLLPDANISLLQYKANYWYIDVNPQPGQTTGTTTITICATNLWGFSTNATMLVKLSPPLELDPPNPYNPAQMWWTSGNAPWFSETNVEYAGLPAAQTGALGFDEESWLETIVNGPGTLSFWLKAAAPYGGNLVFTANGSNTMLFNGVFDWQQITTNLPAGPSVLLWRYLTDVSSGNNTFWIDDVTFVAPFCLQVVGTPENGQCQLLAHVTSGNLYEVLASTNLASWFPISVFTATNNTMPLVDTNAAAGTRFYRLKELPPTSFWLEPPKWLVNLVQLVLHGRAGQRLQLQASRDMRQWSSVGVVTNSSGTAKYTDILASNWPTRFYRAELLP